MLLMKISIEIDKEILLNRVEYKYSVLHGNDKTSWEFVPGKAALANRILPIRQEQIQQQLTGVYIRIYGII